MAAIVYFNEINTVSCESHLINSPSSQFKRQKLKSKTIHILPIILALTLPALRFYLPSEARLTIDNSAIAVYVFSSLILYNAWYLFCLLWDIKKGKNKWYVLALISSLVILMALYSAFIKVNYEGMVVRIFLPIVLFIAIQYALKSQQKASGLFLNH